MALVTLDRLWINPLADLTAGVSFRLGPLSAAPQLPQEIRQYGTRLRAVSTGVKAKQISVTVRCNTRAQVEFLEAYQGEEVCVRDPRRRKFYATYLDPQIPEQYSNNVPVSVTLTFNEITVSESA